MSRGSWNNEGLDRVKASEFALAILSANACLRRMTGSPRGSYLFPVLSSKFDESWTGRQGGQDGIICHWQI
jgi:hypothetical protein